MNINKNNNGILCNNIIESLTETSKLHWIIINIYELYICTTYRVRDIDPCTKGFVQNKYPCILWKHSLIISCIIWSYQMSCSQKQCILILSESKQKETNDKATTCTGIQCIQ